MNSTSSAARDEIAVFCLLRCQSCGGTHTQLPACCAPAPPPWQQRSRQPSHRRQCTSRCGSPPRRRRRQPPSRQQHPARRMAPRRMAVRPTTERTAKLPPLPLTALHGKPCQSQRAEPQRRPCGSWTWRRCWAARCSARCWTPASPSCRNVLPRPRRRRCQVDVDTSLPQVRCSVSPVPQPAPELCVLLWPSGRWANMQDREHVCCCRWRARQQAAEASAVSSQQLCGRRAKAVCRRRGPAGGQQWGRTVPGTGGAAAARSVAVCPGAAATAAIAGEVHINVPLHARLLCPSAALTFVRSV